MQSVTQSETAAAEIASPSRMTCLFRRLIAVAGWLYLPVVFAAWVLLQEGDSWWPATLWMFSPRWLLALPLLPLGLLALAWRRRSLPLLLAMLLLIVGPIMGFRIPWGTMGAATPQGPRLRVLTFNIHHQMAKRQAMADLLAETRPDVVVVQELPSHDPFAYFGDPSWRIHRTGGHFLASRSPIRRTQRFGSDSMHLPGSLYRYELETPAGLVTLFSLHFASPRDAIFEATHHPTTGGGELEENSEVRRRQWDHLLELADGATGPLLLTGDFNTPTESILFRSLPGRYRDAFSTAGWGWGYTFLNARTTVRIDHILMGPSWHCERCWVGPNVGPPHRPVLADLIWTGSP